MKSSVFILPIALLAILPAVTVYGMGEGHALIDQRLNLDHPPPEKVRALVTRGVELAEHDRPREAISVLREARSLAPNYLRVHLEYIRVMENYLGRFGAVEAEYESLIKKEPDNPVYLMAMYSGSDGNFGRDALERVAKRAPDWSWGHYAKALLLENVDPEKAVLEYLSCIARDPSIRQAYLRVIRLQETKLNRIDEAIATAEQFAAQPELKYNALPILWRLRLDKANQSREAKDSLSRELQQTGNTSHDVKLLAVVRTVYSNLLDDDESAHVIEEKIKKIDPTWYPTRGVMFSGVFFNESGIPRYVVLTNRQLAIYNETRESLESPTPKERIRRREDLLLLNLNASLRRVLCEDIFRLAVASNDVTRTVKYAELLHHIDPLDTGVLAEAALVLARNTSGLNRALRYARIAAKATAEFRPAQRPPNTPRKIFETYFSEQKQQAAYEQNRAVALEALGSVLYQMGNYEEAEIALRKSLNLKPSTARTTALISALRKLNRNDEADALLAKINKDLEKALEQKLVNEHLEDFQLNSIDGRLYNPGSLKGKVVLINFWATWCGPCKDELPVLVKLYEKYRGRGLEILSISTDDDHGLIFPFAAGYKLTFPVFYDTGIKDRLKVDVIPTSIFVGRDGMIHYRKVGFNQESAGEIEAVITHLIK